MNIVEKIRKKQSNILGEDAITICFFGDSVTQGCFEDYKIAEDRLTSVCEYKSAYATRLGNILNFLYPKVQFNIINCGLSGTNATWSKKYVLKNVKRYKPDLTVVSFGLNDTYYGDKGIENYKKALRVMFEGISKAGSEIIFLTQNYMCDYVSPKIVDPHSKVIAEDLVRRQKSEVLKRYFDGAKEVCEEYGAKVCDIYGAWKKMNECGVDTTALLAGDPLNHPRREMHFYTAVKLAETIFGII